MPNLPHARTYVFVQTCATLFDPPLSRVTILSWWTLLCIRSLQKRYKAHENFLTVSWTKSCKAVLRCCFHMLTSYATTRHGISGCSYVFKKSYSMWRSDDLPACRFTRPTCNLPADKAGQALISGSVIGRQITGPSRWDVLVNQRTHMPDSESNKDSFHLVVNLGLLLRTDSLSLDKVQKARARSSPAAARALSLTGKIHKLQGCRDRLNFNARIRSAALPAGIKAR